MAENDQKRHAIMFAYPFQGHVIPAVHLAIKLASNGFTITFINTQSIHHQLSKAQLDDGDDDIFAGSRQSGLDIRYRTVSDGLPLEFDRNGNIVEFLERMLHEFLEYADELVGELVRTSTPPVTFLIADTLHVGLLEVANKYGLVSVSLWTQPALVLTLYYHLDLLRTHGHYASGTVLKGLACSIKLDGRSSLRKLFIIFNLGIVGQVLTAQLTSSVLNFMP